ncbi:MAG: UDP-4-amino-4,6-dideoxy-N-acetyl-beta-L-altrosamine N-acetyltransferase [Thermoplasmatales archaeon]|nr:MAG: UDP-4-amino-4,6-dideoxy-N-acetyl-beta-L-altrosamine N-acetyltransferase [Thermoplasmatales archaeon]
MTLDLEYIRINDIDKKTLEQIRKWRNLPGIRKNMINDHIISKKEHNEWVEKVKNSKDTFVWTVYQNDIPIGIVNLKNIDYKNRITDWGLYIAEEECCSKGLSKNILYNLMSHAFDEMKLRKMYTYVLEDNLIAINLYKKMGFEKEGCLKNQLIRNGKLIDLYSFSIFLEKWKKIKEKLKQEENLKDFKLK